MRCFIYLSYKGTAYHGWQRQPNALSLQEVIEDALSLIFRQPISITGAGRTDAGVHARQMVAHVDFDDNTLSDDMMQQLRNGQIVCRLNNLLARDISIERIVRVTDDAHARFSATKRTYHYYVSSHKTAFCDELITQVSPTLDFSLMNQAAQLLIGQQDFASFAKLHTDVKTTICNVTEAQWQPVNDFAHCFCISADRFLRDMVRATVGTLMMVGKGKISIDDFQHIIDQKNRCAAGSSAPANGLYLQHIEYPEHIFLDW